MKKFHAQALRAGTAPLALGIALMAMPAFAQEAEAEDAASETIIVTGSRIARPNLESASPIAVITGEQTTANGDVTLDTYLNTLPQVNPAGTSTSNNPGNGGQANIDLRGLGSNRNLVLINGRRPMVSDSGQTVDLNTIPQGLIKRIDVMTGGAGAAYGADAIAGVVNVVLNDSFEGLDLRANYANHLANKDAREYQFSGTIGGNFADGRGNIAFSAEYASRQGLIKAQRPFASQATSTTGTPPVGRLIENNPIPQSAIDALFASYGVSAAQTPRSGLSQLHFNSDGSLFGSGTFNNPLDVSNYRGAADGTDAAGANQNFFPDFYSYNFDAINLLVNPLERKSAFMTAKYEIIPEATFFTQASYTQYTSANALAPTPIGTRIYATSAPGGASFATSNLITPGSFITNSVVPVTNPFIPADLARLLAARTGNDASLVGSGATEAFRMGIRSLGTGLRQSNYDNEVMQILGGLRGDLGADWRYEAYYSWGQTTIDRSATGNVNVQKLQQLLEAPDGGRSLCAGGYNPFGIQPISPECVAFLDETGQTRTRFTQQIAQAFVSGSLTDLPGGPLGVVLGVESRRFRYTFDPGALAGPIAGFNTATPDNGTNNFFDIFGEVLAPITNELSLSLGYRYSRSDFNDIQNGVDGQAKGSSAYKAELTYAPIDELRFRGSYQRSVRAPNFGELFSGGASFVQAFDPCSVTTEFRKNGGAGAAALCQGTGVGNPAAFVATPGLQVNLGFAGNPNLKPEKSDAFTAGMVFNIGGLVGSLDYYNIKISDAIFGPDTNLFLAACYGYQGGFNAALSASNPYCSSVVRAGSNLSFVAVDSSLGGDSNSNFLLQNIGGVKTSGIDLQLGYKIPTPFAGEESAISLDGFFNYLIDYKVQELPGVTLDYADTVSYFGAGLGTSFPRFKATGNIAWKLGGVTVSSRIRYIDGMKNRASVQFPGETSFTGVGSVVYADFAFQADVGPLTWRIGVNNAFDRKPPQYAPNVQSGTDPSLYDVIGRRGYVSARLRF
ncbi:TonB-dependent receptor [Novosphingobium sp. ERN07]|uniref:TonB-dependent receptor domain-containing protein n=1 Tax=Novosphingobium sp. ERN07 TaxID=2726187 RepID=UPI001457587C|nr:TonB-dependent receptor [Novosphingobium sp. ERN07]NLR69722.1 TonB-dependent receptor [Novosphingobium sp. ERN07]